MAHKTAMAIQTFISHILQSRHIQGILVACVENYYTISIVIIPISSSIVIIPSNLKLHH